MSTSEDLYERVPSGVRGWLKKRRATIATVASGIVAIVVLSALGADDAADAEKEKLLRSIAEDMVCASRNLPSGCDVFSAAARTPHVPPPLDLTNPLMGAPGGAALPAHPLSVGPSASEVAATTALDAARDRINFLETRIESLAVENGAVGQENDQLRRALAAANRERDSAANAAAMAAMSEVENRYEDQVCFSRPDWDAYRVDLGRLCAGEGGG